MISNWFIYYRVFLDRGNGYTCPCLKKIAFATWTYLCSHLEGVGRPLQGTKQGGVFSFQQNTQLFKYDGGVDLKTFFKGLIDIMVARHTNSIVKKGIAMRFNDFCVVSN